MTLSIKAASTWQEVENVHVKVAGEWKGVKEAFTKVNGVWQPIFEGTPTKWESLDLSLGLSMIAPEKINNKVIGLTGYNLYSIDLDTLTTTHLGNVNILITGTNINIIEVNSIKYLYLYGGYISTNSTYNTKLYRINLTNIINNTSPTSIPFEEVITTGEVIGNSLYSSSGVLDNKLIIFSGSNTTNSFHPLPKNTIHYLDPITNVWHSHAGGTSITPVTLSRSCVIGDAMYIYGGMRGEQSPNYVGTSARSTTILQVVKFLGDGLLYVTKVKDFKNIASSPSTRFSHGVCAKDNDAFYAYGGFAGSVHNDLWEYSISADSWKFISNSPNFINATNTSNLGLEDIQGSHLNSDRELFFINGTERSITGQPVRKTYRYGF